MTSKALWILTHFLKKYTYSVTLPKINDDYIRVSLITFRLIPRNAFLEMMFFLLLKDDKYTNHSVKLFSWPGTWVCVCLVYFIHFITTNYLALVLRILKWTQQARDLLFFINSLLQEYKSYFTCSSRALQFVFYNHSFWVLLLCII